MLPGEPSRRGARLYVVVACAIAIGCGGSDEDGSASGTGASSGSGAGSGASQGAGGSGGGSSAGGAGGVPEITVCSESQPCFYVTERGAGTGDGSSWANAHAGLPSEEMHQYAGLPIASLSRNTTYLLADGSYPGYVFDNAGGGTETITIQKAIGADHGDPTGWDDSMGDGEAVFTSDSAVWLFSPGAQHYRFDGRVGEGKAPGGYGFRLYSTAERGGDSSTYMINIDSSGLYDDVGDVFFLEIDHVELDWDNGTPAGPCGFAAGLQAHGAKTNGEWRMSNSYIHHASGGAAYLRNGSHYAFDNVYFQLMGDETESGACPTAPDHGHWETFWITIEEDLVIENSVFEDAYGAGQTGWIIMEAQDVRLEGNLLFCSAADRCAVGGNGVVGAWSASTNTDVLITKNTFKDFFNGAHYLFEQGTNIVITDNTYDNAPGLEDNQ